MQAHGNRRYFLVQANYPGSDVWGDKQKAVAAIDWLAANDKFGIMRKVVANNPNAAEHPLKYDQPILALSAILRSRNLPTPRKSSIPPAGTISGLSVV